MPAPPQHVAIIMDGNGRWARARGKPRAFGHRAGVEAVRKAVHAAGDLGVRWLTLFSFSTENWNRPPREVGYLFKLMQDYVDADLHRFVEEGVRVRVIGGREGLDPKLIALIDRAESATAHNSDFHLIIAFNYGGRSELARAAAKLAKDVEAGVLCSSAVDESALAGYLDTAGMPDPDLLIRTSGEQRVSNFLLWQCAYSELVFLDCMWPDFDAAQFAAAVETFAARDRRFGALKPEADPAYAQS